MSSLVRQEPDRQGSAFGTQNVCHSRGHKRQCRNDLLVRGEVKDGDSDCVGNYIGSDNFGMVPLPVDVGGGLNYSYCSNSTIYVLPVTHRGSVAQEFSPGLGRRPGRSR